MPLRLALLLALVVLGPEARGQETFVIPIAEDTLLYVDNQGATRVLIELNDVTFKLVTRVEELAQSRNAYLIPLTGVITIDIAPYMRPGKDANVISFLSQGPPGTRFDFVLAPVFVEGQTEAAYRLSGLGPLPDQFRLRAGPNPAAGPVTIRYEIPAGRIAGVPVRLSVVDLRGRRVQTLVDDVRYPGAFAVQWDGTDGSAPAASGVYVIWFETDIGSEVVRVTRVR